MSNLAKQSNDYMTISEVSKETDIPAHVIRFWETKFTSIKPVKRTGGRRFYTKNDIDLLRKIDTLVHEKGYTIRGASKVISSEQQNVQSIGGDESSSLSQIKAKLLATKQTLEEIKVAVTNLG
jgi:DNA-binding transcriptional MerR regulator